MVTVRSVLEALERLAPSRTAFEWDRIGLQVGDPAHEVTAAVVALDPSPSLLDFAVAARAEFLLCHHPVIWDPLKSLTTETRSGRLASKMASLGLSFVAAHTNWDAAPNGINGRLSDLLGLRDSGSVGAGQKIAASKVVVMAPGEAVEPLIDAMSAAGAGVIGLYERCAFRSEGTGTFVGSGSSNPSVGQAGRVETVPEHRIEMRVSESGVSRVVEAIRSVHPYEEPAFDIYPLRPEVERPLTRIGTLATPMNLSEFAAHVDRVLETRCWTFGDSAKPIRMVAVCGGAADDEWRSALRAGADVFVTGEVKHHNAAEAAEAGLAILAAGHYATEHPGCLALAEAMANEVPEVRWAGFEPPPGVAGRPIF